MKKKMIRLFSIALAAIISISMFAGCSKKETTVPAKSGQAAQSQTQESPKAGGKISEKPITLTYWTGLDSNSAAVLSNYADMEMYKEMEKRSNIKMVFKHPPVGQEKEQFNLMIASRDLTDLIEYGWVGYPGGPEKAISDTIIIKLNDLIDKNGANFKKILNAEKDVNRQARTDIGTLYQFPAIGVNTLKAQSGPIIRKDWLDELGLKAPETIDDWTAVLTQFKEKKGATAPITGDIIKFISNDTFVGAFGVGNSYYQDNGKVKYGPMEPAYKQYLELLKNWYKAGLLDPDFAANNGKAVESKMTTNKSGVLDGYSGSGIGTYMNAMKGKDPKYNLVGISYPVLKKGSEPLFHHRAWEVRTSGGVAITSINKYPNESARWADYFFSDEGNLLKNFGMDGQTYKLENNYPKYTELITKNPNGLPMSQALGKYCRASAPSPGLIDPRYGDQYNNLPQQIEANNVWNKYADNALKVLIPPVTATQQEADELSTIAPTLESYRQEMFVKFVMGQESLDNFDKFVEQLKKMKIQRAIELKQAALDRYNKR